MPENQTELVDSKAIAALFGVTTRRVQQLTEEGVIQSVKKGRANRYELISTAQTYIRYLSDKLNHRDAAKDKTAEMKKLEADADYKRSKADIAALQLKELQGKLHRSEDVEAVMTDMIYHIRAMLIALPGRLAMDAANAKTAPEASEIIRKEVYAVMEELSGYRYDPEEYARRVREREGWEEAADDGEEE